MRYLRSTGAGNREEMSPFSGLSGCPTGSVQLELESCESGHKLANSNDDNWYAGQEALRIMREGGIDTLEKHVEKMTQGAEQQKTDSRQGQAQ